MPNTHPPEPDPSLWGSISPSIARAFGVFPFSQEEDGTLVLAVVDSRSVDKESLEFMIGRPVSIISFSEGTSPAAVDELVDQFYSDGTDKGEVSSPSASELASFLYLCDGIDVNPDAFVHRMEREGWTGEVVATIEDAIEAVQCRSFGKIWVSTSFTVPVDRFRATLEEASPGIVVDLAPDEFDDDALVDRYERALSAGDGGVWEYDFRTRRTWFSRGLVQLLGLGQSFQDGGLSVWRDRLIPREDFSHVDKVFAHAVSCKSGDFDVKHRLLTSDEKEVWVHSRGSIIRTHGQRGRVVKLAGSTTLLSQEEFMMRHAMDEIDGCFIFVKDRDLRFRLVNQALAKAFKKNQEEIIGKKDSDLVTDDDQIAFFQETDLALLNSETSGRLAIGEEFLTDGSGRKRILSTIKRVLSMPSGEKWLLGVATDISDLKSLRSQLDTMLAMQQLQSAAFRELLNETSHIVWIAECSGRVICHNDGYSQIPTSFWKSLHCSSFGEPRREGYFDSNLPSGEKLVIRQIAIRNREDMLLGTLWIARICSGDEQANDTWIAAEIDQVVHEVVSFTQNDPELKSLGGGPVISFS